MDNVILLELLHCVEGADLRRPKKGTGKEAGAAHCGAAHSSIVDLSVALSSGWTIIICFSLTELQLFKRLGNQWLVCVDLGRGTLVDSRDRFC